MRYGIVVIEGAAGDPVDELDGLTALEAATTPNLDRVAVEGRVGCVAAAPEGAEAFASARVGALLGHDTSTGGFEPGPAIAAAHGVEAPAGASLIALRLICAGPADKADEKSTVFDARPAGLTAPEGRALFERLDQAWDHRPEGARIVACGGADGVLVDPMGAMADAAAACASPERLVRTSWRRALPGGEAAGPLRSLLETSAQIMRDDAVNRARTAAGQAPVNALWAYGPGRAAAGGDSFEDRWGIRGAFVGAADAALGAARLAGLERVVAPGATGDERSDLAAKGRYAAGALDRYGVVVAHVAAPGVAAARGDWHNRLRLIEDADAHVVGPLLSRLETFAGDDDGGDDARGWRMLVVLDRSPDARGEVAPSPFALAGAWVRSVLQLRATERGAEETDLFVDRGFDLLEYVLRSGLKRTVRAPRAAGANTGRAVRRG